jgi:hypothetical protein
MVEMRRGYPIEQRKEKIGGLELQDSLVGTEAEDWDYWASALLCRRRRMIMRRMWDNAASR